MAENSGGVHCLKYGLTVHNVLKVKGFTIEGEEVEFGSDALDASGYDLLSVIIGSEGMLAVTTEVTVKLVPSPQLARCIMASFDDLRKAGNAVAGVIAAGIIPAGLEMMDKPMTAAVEDFVHAGYDLNAVAILLCESDGTPEEVEEEIGRMSEVLRLHGATAVTVSQNESERLRFWSGRKNAFPAFTVTSVGGTSRGLHVGDAVGLGAKDAEKSFRRHGSSADFNIEWLLQYAALASPEILQLKDEFLKRKRFHSHE